MSNKESILKKEIGGKKKDNPFPTKTSINFISNAQERKNKIALILFPIFLVVLALFVYFCVIGPLNKVSEAESKYNAVVRQNEQYKEILKNYSEIQREYNELTGNFLNENESSYFDRTEIIEMIEEDVLSSVNLSSLQINGNVIKITTGSTTMNDISNIVNVLLNDSRVADVNAKTAKASEDSSVVTASLEIVYGGVE